MHEWSKKLITFTWKIFQILYEPTGDVQKWL